MNTDSAIQNKITEFWSSVAPYYETDPDNTAQFGTDAYRRWVGVVSRALPSVPGDVLDSCTGTGFAALIAASLGHRVVGVDLAPSMLEIARRTAKAHDVDIRFIEGDVLAPGLEEGSFDAVICRHSLWTLRDANTAIGNWYGLLRPKGRVVVMDCFHAWGAAQSERDEYFYSYYTPDVRAALLFLNIQDRAPLSEAFTRAGFAAIEFEVLPDTFGGDGLRPYLLVAHRD